MAPRTLVAIALVLLLASPVFAEWAVVVDLDSNVANGPDTLEVEPDDTVLVRVWITGGPDSLVGFGITVGDTSGVLDLVTESTGSVYTTPEAWSNISAQEDSAGFLLLQAVDFSFSAPLYVPSQVARLRFVANDSGTCATFAWDSTMCGWQNWEFGEGTFQGFEATTVCVVNDQDGDTPPTEGGGEETSPEPGDSGVPAGDAAYSSDGATYLPSSESNALPGVVIVQFRPEYFELPDDVSECSRQGALIHDSLLAEVLTSAGISEIERLLKHVAPDDPIRCAKNGRCFDLSSLLQTFVLRTGDSTPARDLLLALSQCAFSYNYAEPSYPMEYFGFPEGEDTLPSDPLFLSGGQPHIDYTGGFGLNMGAVWPVTTGNRDIRLGIGDVEVELDHEDFRIREADGSDAGYRFKYINVCHDGGPGGTVFHGQQVVGIAAALTHNKEHPDSSAFLGIAGVTGGRGFGCADSVQGCMVDVLFFDASVQDCGGAEAHYANIVAAAIDSAVDVLNFSNGLYYPPIGDPPDTLQFVTVNKVFVLAYKAGMTVVAGNLMTNGFNPPALVAPAGIQPNRMIAVNTGKPDGVFNGGSQRGAYVDVLAIAARDAQNNPLMTTLGDSQYGSANAATSSFAAPQVSATAALLMSSLLDRYPERRALHEENEALIKSGANPCDTCSANALPDSFYGYGFVSAGRSIGLTRNPWFWLRERRTGRDSAVAQDTTRIRVWKDAGGEGPMAEGLFVGIPHAIYKTVEMPLREDETVPIVVGIGEGLAGDETHRTNGWTLPGDRNSFYALYQDYYCEVDTVTETEATLRTYVWHFIKEVVISGGETTLVDLSPTLWMPTDTSQTSNHEWFYSVFVKDIDSTATTIPQYSGGGTLATPSILSVSPTPFNPQTRVAFYLPDGVEAKLGVFDLSGRLVRELRLGERRAGYHEVVWDGDDDLGRRVASGVYFLRLTGGLNSCVRKAVLVR